MHGETVKKISTLLLLLCLTRILTHTLPEGRYLAVRQVLGTATRCGLESPGFETL
jgi:hypothetical protein